MEASNCDAIVARNAFANFRLFSIPNGFSFKYLKSNLNFSILESVKGYSKTLHFKMSKK